jgi:LAO/AO transport system kinase
MDFRQLARDATSIENQEPGALARLHDQGVGLVVGITGPPGAGKSSLVDAMAGALRLRNKTVAIIAVDPSSHATGGAILGDRIRMQRHHGDPGIFIRSMASRGAGGGLARTTANMAKLFRASGFDYVFVETVGVGQGEIEVAGLADVTVVVLVPGMGDDIQALKAGILEIASVFALNKSDLPGAERTEQEIHEERSAPIVRTIATQQIGIDDLLKAIDAAPRRKVALPSSEYEIDHLGIAVKSLDAALAFYEGQLGMTGRRETVEQEKVHVAMLPAHIELLEAASPDSTIAKFIGKRGEGLHHVALRVPDLEGLCARLDAAGVRVLGTPQRGAGGHLYVFIHPSSTGGVLLELIQKQEQC